MSSTWKIWDNKKVYDRMGIDSEYTEILGIKVPVLTIPVKPGRNLAIIIEVAAMNNRQKRWAITLRRSSWPAWAWTSPRCKRMKRSSNWIYKRA